MRRCLIHIVGLAALLAWRLDAGAGGGPQNVLLVVNDNSSDSLELGNYYREKRGIPDRNVLHITTTTNINIDTATFTNEIRQPILNYIASSGLSNQIDYIVLSRDIPFRVHQGASSNSITAALFYDFKTNALPPCSIPYPATRSDYYEAERAFSRAGAPSSNRYYLTTLLTAFNMDQARRIIDRSVVADYSQPTGTVFLLHTLDPRNIQWYQFEHADFMARFLAIPEQRAILDADFIAGQTNVMGYMVGRQSVDSLLSNHFQPGALADHVTSFGGELFGGASGQMSILEWMRAGCVGSYGTVVEPCAITNKFPNPRVHYWYGRGFNMGESYWMSVRDPYEGVFVGDPLCAPYAAPPGAEVHGLASNAVVSGTVSLAITGLSAQAQGRVSRIDLYLDDVLLTTLTNAAPTASNLVTITINGSNFTHGVLPGQDLFRVATSLAARINHPVTGSTGVSARAFGDRIELVQKALGQPGASITYSAQTAQGPAGELTLHAVAAGTNFLETTYRALEGVTLQGTPLPGDRVRAVVTRLDGARITNEVMATTNETTALRLLSNLVAAVNADTNLQDAGGCEVKYLRNAPPAEAYFVARTNTWEGNKLQLEYTVFPTNGSTLAGPNFSDNFNDNGTVLSARGTVFLSDGRPELFATYVLSTTNLPDGPHRLRVVVTDGSATRSQGHAVIPFVADNNSVTCTVVQPPPGAHFLVGSVVTTRVEAATAFGSVTQVLLFVEGKQVLQTNAPPFEFIWNTASYGAGSIQLQARADSTEGSALSDIHYVVVYSDNDGDGISDQWEYLHFGSAATYGATNDPDGDGANNFAEYLADTEPTNAASLFHIMSLDEPGTNPVATFTFQSGTTRQYRVEYHDANLTNGALWTSAGTNAFRGAQGSTVWSDDGSEIPPPADAFRSYRVGVSLP